MENSIENIWKSGFLKEDALIAPKVNDLYNRKSKHIVERLKRMFEINIKSIYVFATFTLLAYVFLLKLPIVGLILATLFVAVGMKGNSNMKKMHELDQNQSNYNYLKGFDNWLQLMIANGVKTMRFFYPLCFLLAVASMWFSGLDEIINNKLSNDTADIIILSGSIIVALVFILMIYYGEKIYRWDINIVYGRMFKKLKEIIADMEELRV